VPLNDDAYEVLARRLSGGKEWAFTRQRSARHEPRRVSRHDPAMFARACQAVGIRDFHWHDLRHTWASWHVQARTPLMVLKELGGWETIQMVQKYAHLAPSHLAAHANSVKIWSRSPARELQKAA
jgi:integrase